MNTPPEFTKPSRPDFGPLQKLHRDHDGNVSIAALDDWGVWSEPFSIPAKRLGQRWFPELDPWLIADSFATVNGQQWGTKEPSRIKGLRRGRRSNENTKYLTSCWADIDCYKLDMEIGTVIGEVINAEKAERIPRVSMIMNSGGGLWLFWFIHDRLHTDKPLRAYPPSIVNMWAATQRTIFEKFAPYGADPRSLDLCHVARIPGSINTKWNERVEYWMHLDHTGTPYSYSLPELVECFDVFTRSIPKPKKRKAKLPKPDGEKDPVKQAAGRKGQRRRWEIDLENMYVLWNMRGTFAPGTRNDAVRFLVRFMYGTKDFSTEEIWSKANELYYTFDQPSRNNYSRKQFSSTVKSVLNPSRGTKDQQQKLYLKRQPIADCLDVTPEESRVLNKWPPATRFKSSTDQTPKPVLTRTQETRRRRLAIRQIVDGLDGAVPTIHALLDLLQKNHGIEPVSTATIRMDLIKSHIRTGREHRRKTPKPDTPVLFPKDK